MRTRGPNTFAPPVSTKKMSLSSNYVSLFQLPKILITEENSPFSEEQKKFVKQWFDEHPNDSVCHVLKNKRNELASTPSLKSDFRVLCDRTSNPPSYWVIYYGKKHGKELGEGGESVVKKCFNMETNEWLAVKAYDANIEKMFPENEYRKLQLLNIPSYFIETDKKPFLISPIHQGKALLTDDGDELLKNISDQARIEIVLSFLWELKNLHEKNVIHRDMKPNNMIVNFEKNTVKIIDFSFAVTKQELKEKTPIALANCGTDTYMHPSVLMNLRMTDRTSYSETNDIYPAFLCIAKIFNSLTTDGYSFFINSNEASTFAKKHVTPFLEKESKKQPFLMLTLDQLILKFNKLKSLLANSSNANEATMGDATPSPMR